MLLITTMIDKCSLAERREILVNENRFNFFFRVRRVLSTSRWFIFESWIGFFDIFLIALRDGTAMQTITVFKKGRRDKRMLRTNPLIREITYWTAENR